MKYNNEFDKLVSQVQSLSPENLADKGILNHSADGLFVCPFCHNGEGEDGTGIDFKDTGNTFISHCFKCGESFNIIHVLARHFNLDSKSQFREVILQAAKLFNLDIPKSRSARKELKDYSASINFAKQNLQTLLNKFGDGKSFRGLTADTLKHFQVGFNPRFTYKKTFSERVIIPTSKYHFLARSIDKSVTSNKKIHLGPKGIFNFNQLNSANADDVFFMVEGEFDAMSIYQVGFNAIAISGSEITSNSDYGTSQLHELKSVTVKPNIIVMLDNDHKSDNVADKLVAKLQHIGYKAAKAFLPDAFDNQPISDSNDLLQLDPAALASTLPLYSIPIFFIKQSFLRNHKKHKRSGIKSTYVASLFTNNFRFLTVQNVANRRSNPSTQVSQFSNLRFAYDIHYRLDHCQLPK